MMLLSMLSEKQKDENSLISVGRDCQRHPHKSITVQYSLSKYFEHKIIKGALNVSWRIPEGIHTVQGVTWCALKF